jgi:hypothetical protein
MERAGETASAQNADPYWLVKIAWLRGTSTAGDCQLDSNMRIFSVPNLTWILRSLYPLRE